MNRLSRREFLRMAGLALGSVAIASGGCASRPASAPGGTTPPNSPGVPPPPEPTLSPTPAPTATPSPAPTRQQAYVAVSRGTAPATITRAAIAALGGMQRFVRRGSQVVIKPNICVGYHTPEYAATTNPTVVGTLVGLCLEAGARSVRVMDMPLSGTAESAYTLSGIGEAVRAAGGEMEVMSPAKFVKTAIPQGRDITSWEVYRGVLDADVLINVPIAKHHSLARLTLGHKNLMGTVRSPNLMHRNLGQRVADLSSLLRPALTVVDAVRILVAHGPTGGSLSDVRQTNTVIASHDMVAADAWAATLFGLRGEDIDYVRAAADMGLGTLKLDEVKVEEIAL